MTPPGDNFQIVNNTTGVVPPSSDCANYTMTVTLCPSTVNMTASRTPNQSTVLANSLGQAVVPLTMKYQNTGDFTATVSADTVSETLHVSVLDGQLAAVNTQVGKGGAIVPPGAFITQTFPLQFSGSQFTCLPRTYTVSSQMTAIAEPYYCNGFNPPSAVVQSGSVLPLDNFDEDTFAFQSLPGTFITVTVDTVSAATAFDIEACVSGTPNGTCLPAFKATIISLARFRRHRLLVHVLAEHYPLIQMATTFTTHASIAAAGRRTLRGQPGIIAYRCW